MHEYRSSKSYVRNIRQAKRLEIVEEREKEKNGID